MTITKGVEVRSFYRQKAHLLISNNPGRLDLVDADMAAYEKDLKDMLQVYCIECNTVMLSRYCSFTSAM